VLWYLGTVPQEMIWPAAGLWAGDTFMIIEGVIGWCALRALVAVCVSPRPSNQKIFRLE